MLDTQSLLQIGLQHHIAGRREAAAQIYHKLLQIEPACIEAIYLSGLLAYQSGRHEIAVNLLRRAVTARPAHYNSIFFLGLALLHSGRAGEAVNHLRKATILAEGGAAAQYYLALAAFQCGQLDEAGAAALEALSIDPARSDAADIFSKIFERLVYEVDDVRMQHFYNRVFAMQPPAPVHLLYKVAMIVFNNGHHEMGVAAFRELLRRHPEFELAHAALIDSLFLHAPDQEVAFAELERWREQHVEPLRQEIAHLPNDRNPNRKLRIGFLSLHLMDANTFLSVWPGWFEGYDPAEFEIYIYIDEIQKYETVREFTISVDVTRDTAGMSDAALAKLIQQDRIDILIDLYGRGPVNRMCVLARKPAPIQVAWGPISTGMDLVDYFISDRVAIPKRCFQRYKESIVWMPHSYLAWVPPDEEIQVPLRHLDAGQAIVFGSFNRAVKITPMTLNLWARILLTVPGSRLLMKGSVGDQPQLQRKYLAAMAAGGVEPGRIDFLGSSHRSSHLAAYRHVDIQLDTVPEQGGITTLESLWCGVPVVSWCYDDRILTRSGATICNALGLSDLIADTPEAFVSIAHALANDSARLKELRASLRGRMMRSPLLDLQRYSNALQVAFREMWRRYCRADPPGHFDVAALIPH